MKKIRSILFLLKKYLVDLTGIWFYNVGNLPIGTHLEYFLKYRTSCDFVYVFDVGANIGQFSNKFRLFFPRSEIFLFEPVISTFKILESKIKGNHLQSFNFGFGDKEEKIEILINNQAGSPRNSVLNFGNNELKIREIVSLRKLDDFVSSQGIRRIDLLKIDVEGYELHVLEGASNSLKSGMVSFIYIEVGLSREKSFHIPLPQMIQVLKGFGFQFLGLFQTNYKHLSNGFSYSNALFIHSGSTCLLK